MADAELLVEQVGPLTSIQDHGRPGFMRFGVTRSGPMDRDAYAIAQAALGNVPETAAIETTVGGLTLRCVSGSVSFAATGGGFRVGLDGSKLRPWPVAELSAGARLQIAPGYWGCWTYLAFAGRLKSASWLGSQATHAPSGFGGGRLSVGDRLVIEGAEVRPDRHGHLPIPVSARPRHEIRIVLGPQDRYFSRSALTDLLASAFTLTDSYDRMGVRLRGPRLAIESKLDMPSEALLRGSIQVPGHGDPVVLLADHQTTGGYPKIAVIATVDQDCFAQLRPRQIVGFRAVTPEQAIAALRIRMEADRAFLAALARRRASRAD